MAKRFKAKKKIHIPKLITYFIIGLLIYLFYKWVSSLSISKIDNDLLEYLNNYYHVYSYNEEKVKLPFFKIITGFKNNINNPQTLLIHDLVYSSPKKEQTKVAINSEKQTSYPLVYIYNTHQKESYSSTYMEDYNVNPDVLLVSHIMQEKLNNINIKTIVEENSISSYLDEHHLDYSKSYQASRFYLAQTLKNYNNLKLIIDLHRDAASYEATTFIGEKKYAKLMFVVGKENANYKINEGVMTRLNELIVAKNPSLSRGILEKEGKGVNGVYNQDMFENIILLELGGDKNNIDELINTIDILVEVIKEYLNEKR